MITLVTLALIFSFLGAAGVATAVLLQREQERTIARRVTQFVKDAGKKAKGKRRPAGAKLLSRLDPRVRWLFTFRTSQSWGTTATAPYLLSIGLIAAALGWLLLHAALHMSTVIAWLAAIGCFLLAPRLLLRRQKRRAETGFAELLPDAIDMIGRMVRAGLPVVVAIRAVSQEASPPVNSVFVKVADLTEIGIPLPEALARVAEDVGSADFRFFGVAVALQQATGGNLVVTLDTLSDIIRKRRAVRMKGRAATAEIRMSAIVLAAIPFFIVGALLIISPGYLTPLITDPRGNVIVGIALSSLLTAGVVMRAMVRRSMNV